MTLGEILNAIIDDGIEAARADYRRPEQDLKLRGSIAGFEACRGKTPGQIGGLLEDARRMTQQAMASESAAYWYWRCAELEVEWVANVMSAILQNEGLPTIVRPTVRGVLRAAEIVGVTRG